MINNYTKILVLFFIFYILEKSIDITNHKILEEKIQQVENNTKNLIITCDERKLLSPRDYACSKIAENDEIVGRKCLLMSAFLSLENKIIKGYPFADELERLLYLDERKIKVKELMNEKEASSNGIKTLEQLREDFLRMDLSEKILERKDLIKIKKHPDYIAELKKKMDDDKIIEVYNYLKLNGKENKKIKTWLEELEKTLRISSLINEVKAELDL